MGEDFGERSPRRPIPGEGQRFGPAPSSTGEIREKILTFEEASKALNTLGKDETGCRYAYLMITATNLKLTDVSIILNFKHVLFVDLSENYLNIDSLQVLTSMPFLILLKAERNRVESVSLSPMHYLQVLDLNQNQIKETANINQPMLECLEMNYNDIYTTQFETAALDNLKQLEMRSNLLFEISGVYPPTIEKLYLAENKISTVSLATMSNLRKLKILHLRQNSLQTLDGFSRDLVNLEYLNLRNNNIRRYLEFKKLENLPRLKVLVLTGNPLPGTQQSEMKGEDVGEGGQTREPALLPLLVILPGLKRINKTVVTAQDRMDAEDLQDQLWETILGDIKSTADSDRDATTTDLTTDYKTESESEI